jgi:HAE1 family hydrophobic/amphiphilic exporter-1
MQKLAEICVRRPVFATMLILSLTVVGLFSYKSLGVDLFPKIDLPTITVTVVNPGASPQEIETEITDQVEGCARLQSKVYPRSSSRSCSRRTRTLQLRKSETRSS